MTKHYSWLCCNSGRWLLLSLSLPFSLSAAAATLAPDIPANVDTSQWACKYCPYEQGVSGEIEIGAGMVSDESFKFGEYNGLHKDGAFLIGNGSVRFRDENAGFLDLRVRDLGLDTRSVDIEAGRQGRYRLFLNYDEISHYLSDSAQTPYRGNGSDTLSLPTSWVPASSTAGMTELGTSLQNVELQTQRKRLDVGASFIPARHWETALTVRHEVRDGQRASAGSVFFNSAQLVEPIDYVTNEVEASVAYTTRKWQSRLAYYGSFFNNHDTSLTWQNAYNPLVAGADTGQLALPPSNLFQQILLSSGYRLNKDTRINGDIAIGRMQQNEDLLTATTNTNLAVTLPRQSAEARIDTLTANLKLNSTVSSKLHLNAAYRFNDRNNKTPSSLFNWITTDAFAAVARRNLPYSFTDRNLSLGGKYRISKLTRVSAGYEYAQKERSHQEVDKTTEGTLWGKVTMRTRKNIDFSLKAAHAGRNASGYHLVSETDPPQNPLLRKYNMADRDRDSGSLYVDINSNERISLSLSIDLSRDNYSDSALGLTESQETSYNADASLLLTEATNLHAFAGREHIRSEQAGSQGFATADWFAKNNDAINSFGIGVTHRLIRDKLGVGLDYMLSRSTGDISIDTGAPQASFPSLKSDLNTLKLYADYRLDDKRSLHMAYWHENYHVTDWTLDNVNPATLSNVIGFGEANPTYNLHLAMMTFRYRF